jgi:DNA-binding MarR family transcriptional regulator
MPERKPIGYWLKELDRRIEDTLDRTLAGEAVTRRDWQVLNALSTQGVAREAVVETLRPFWGTGAIEPDQVLDGLVTRGWVLRDADSRFRLSPEGDAARAGLLERVKELRMTIADGVTPEDYQTTIDTLERMAANLAELD